MIDNKLTRFLWSVIWDKWLWNSYYHDYFTVVKVKGWRTAIVEYRGIEKHTMTMKKVKGNMTAERGGVDGYTMSPCFWHFK